jgi:acyl-CoA thioesterase-1
LAIRLKKTGAKLIWGTTTPACPNPETTMLNRFKTTTLITPAVERQYLDAALRVMKKHNIEVNDLHASIAPKLTEYALAADNVHFTKEGYEKLAAQVTEPIRKCLIGEQENAPDKK